MIFEKHFLKFRIIINKAILALDVYLNENTDPELLTDRNFHNFKRLVFQLLWSCIGNPADGYFEFDEDQALHFHMAIDEMFIKHKKWLPIYDDYILLGLMEEEDEDGYLITDDAVEFVRATLEVAGIICKFKRLEDDLIYYLCQDSVNLIINNPRLKEMYAISSGIKLNIKYKKLKNSKKQKKIIQKKVLHKKLNRINEEFSI